MRETNEAPIATPVWEADRLLGHLLQRRCGQIEAVRANGLSLGWFNTENAALAALAFNPRSGPDIA